MRSLNKTFKGPNFQQQLMAECMKGANEINLEDLKEIRTSFTKV